MFGVQQVANLVAPPPEGRMAGAAAAFDAVTTAAEQQLDGWLKQTYQIGNGLQNGLMDVMMLRAPAIDSSSIMRMAAQMQSGPIFEVAIKYVMPSIGWVDSFLVNRKDGPGTQQEFANKLYIIMLVTQVHGSLGADAASQPITALAERMMTFETFPRLWAVEGLGNYYGDRALEQSNHADVTGLLSDPATSSLPPWTLTMLHAGIGMSFAKEVLGDLTPSSPPEAFRTAIQRFASLCRNSSRRGYTGAALESLGLATRTLYSNLIPQFDREIAQVAPEVYGYFWHGAGRAVYFDPMNMLPSFNAPWRALARLAQDAPNEQARLNAISGFCWAVTVVNMRNPEVMEAFLRHHSKTLASDGAFANGLTSSLLMRYDTSPTDQNIDSFIHHAPNSDPELASTWRRMVTEPCQRAITQVYPPLKQGPSLEELFHYVPRAL